MIDKSAVAIATQYSCAEMDILPLGKPSQQGHVPSPRFGHTFTSVGGGKLLLFGGAIGGAFYSSFYKF